MHGSWQAVLMVELQFFPFGIHALCSGAAVFPPCPDVGSRRQTVAITEQVEQLIYPAVLYVCY